MSRDAQKRAAAEAAVALVRDGMVVGIGTGTTAAFAIDALAQRVRQGLRILGIPTSERSAARARDAGISLTTLAEHRRIALTIDGADEIARGSLDLVKGLGGALLREKIVASASDRLVIVADAAKLVDRLGTGAPVPVEVVPFGWETTAERLARLSADPVLRRGGDGQPYRTDGGNLILDCAFGLIEDAAALEQALSGVVGVVETGLFIGMADTALVADDDGVRKLVRGDPGG
ncbi:MAG TPA: ribose-5-phosphate isomerase RpiA [Acetobacteraceae bacterium]|nr:ribose-5-phosphate isomerase RpiA [Acetobacteraceae bacterium]